MLPTSSSSQNSIKKYSPQFELDSVNVTVVGQASTTLGASISQRELIRQGYQKPIDSGATYLRHLKSQPGKVGSELKVTLVVTFDRLPTPREYEVNEAVKTIMQKHDYLGFQSYCVE